MWNRERSLHHVDIDGRLTLDEKLLLPEIEKGFQLNLFSIDQHFHPDTFTAKRIQHCFLSLKIFKMLAAVQVTCDHPTTFGQH